MTMQGSLQLLCWDDTRLYDYARITSIAMLGDSWLADMQYILHLDQCQLNFHCRKVTKSLLGTSSIKGLLAMISNAYGHTTLNTPVLV